MKHDIFEIVVSSTVSDMVSRCQLQLGGLICFEWFTVYFPSIPDKKCSIQIRFSPEFPLNRHRIVMIGRRKGRWYASNTFTLSANLSIINRPPFLSRRKNFSSRPQFFGKTRILRTDQWFWMTIVIKEMSNLVHRVYFRTVLKAELLLPYSFASCIW